MYRKHLFVSGGIAFLVLILSVAVWYGARRPEVTITEVEVSGGSTVPLEAVRTKAESLLSGTYALLIPRRFSYLFPKTEIIDAIDSMPRVHSTSVVRDSRNKISVTFDEYVPYALWCNAIATNASATPACIFVDDQGFAFATAPALYGETFVRFAIEGRGPVVGEHVYDPETLAHYRSFAEAIATYHHSRLASIFETKDSDLMLSLSSGVTLMITKDADIQSIFENIESILLSEKFKSTPLESFEYIDLRFGSKIYVKEWGAGDEESPVEEALPEQPVPVVAAPETPVVQATATAVTRVASTTASTSTAQ